MPNKFSSGKYAIAECDRCGQRYKLKELRKLVVKQQIKNIRCVLAVGILISRSCR